MKPLAQMTREELWSLDNQEVIDLEDEYGKKICPKIQSEIDYAIAKQFAFRKKNLDTLRLELQQDAADARRESLEDR